MKEYKALSGNARERTTRRIEKKRKKSGLWEIMKHKREMKSNEVKSK